MPGPESAMQAAAQTGRGRERARQAPPTTPQTDHAAGCRSQESTVRRSVEQTFIGHLSARHWTRCHEKYKVNTYGACPQGAHSLEREVTQYTSAAGVTEHGGARVQRGPRAGPLKGGAVWEKAGAHR